MSLALAHRPLFRDAWPWLAAGLALTLALAATLLHDTLFHHGQASAAPAASGGEPKHDTPAASATTVSLPEGKYRSAHIATAPVERTELTSAIDVAGRIDANLDRRVDIHPRAAGVVREVAVAQGQKVKKGDVLATLDSPDVGTARLHLWAKQRDLAVARTEYEWKTKVAANVAQLIPELREGAKRLREEAKGPHKPHEGTKELNEGNQASDIERKYTDRPLGTYRASLLSAYAEFVIAAHEEEKTTGLHAAEVVGEHPYFLAIHTRESAQAKLEGVLEQVRFDAGQQEKIARNGLQMAEGDVVDAAERLRILGVPVDLDTVLAPGKPGAPSAHDPAAALAREDVTAYKILAPFDGTIIDKTAVLSQKVELGDRLFTLANLSDVWIQANIPESDFGLLPALKNGTVHVIAAAYPGRTFDARLLSIGSVVDPTTRTVPLYAEANNLDGLLKLGMFVRIVLDTTAKTQALTVPTSAVVDIEGRKGVFLPSGDDGRTFTFRPVKVGREAEGRYAVLSGVEPGQQVVSQGTFLLKSELILQNETEED
ncbi:MAG: efflux RND transporter periplasmic adaptor subunit [Isosphaeraceae bacterium]|nr:efflux RND transporter periplasmic adaptor subunit [Isosphaeraceae bacterium]